MRLHLSSHGVPSPAALETLVGRSLKGLEVAVIGNAKDARPPDERSKSMRQLREDLGSLGLATAEVDLRDIQGVTAARLTLGDFAMVYVSDGNSFMLRHRLRESDVDKVIGNLVASDLTYCGEGAGAIVAGSVLATTRIEDKGIVPKPLVHEGMGLIDRVVLPHATRPDVAGLVAETDALHGSRILTIGKNGVYIVNEKSTSYIQADEPPYN